MVRKCILFIISMICLLHFGQAQLSTTYDNHGRIASIIYPDSSSIRYIYDAAGNRIYAVISQPCAQSISPSTSITSSYSGPICAGIAVSFSASIVNGGPIPSYQWKKNGNNVGSNSIMYIDSSLNNNDSVWVVLTSSASCASPFTAKSNSFTISVIPVATPSVTINSNPTGFCSATNVSFTSTVTNGGTSPTYQWYLDGNVVGTSATYTDPAFNVDDSVWLVITSNAACTDSPTAFSNKIYNPSYNINGGAGTWTWTGSQSNNWFEPCNWNMVSLPNSLSDVVIPGGTLNEPTIAGAPGFCKAITINAANGGLLTIITTTGGVLNVAH